MDEVDGLVGMNEKDKWIAVDRVDGIDGVDEVEWWMG